MLKFSVLLIITSIQNAKWKPLIISVYSLRGTEVIFMTPSKCIVLSNSSLNARAMKTRFGGHYRNINKT